MEDWKNIIGSGTGIFCFIRTEVANGAILTDDYLGTLEAVSTLPLPNQKLFLAQQLGIFQNVAEKKVEFLRRLKQEVMRVDAAEYIFNVSVYYNSTTDSLSTLNLILANDFTSFITDPDTIEMTAGNGADFLNFLL